MSLVRIVPLLSLLASQAVWSVDMHNGEMLHKENCLKCHQPEIYNRAESKISTFQALRNRVRLCEVSNDLTWFDEELDDVTHYINVNYYGFGLK